MKFNFTKKVYLGLLLAITAITTTSLANTNTVTVCKTGCDYQNPRPAVLEAPANTVIKIKDGIYSIHRPLTFKNDNVRIEGQSKDKTILRFRTNAVNAVEINANNVSLANLTLTQQTPNAKSAISITNTNGTSPTSISLNNLNVILQPTIQFVNEVAGIFAKDYNLVKVTDTTFKGFSYGGLFESAEFDYKNGGITFISTTFENSTIAGLQFNQPATTPGQNFHGRLVFEAGNIFKNNAIGLKFNSCTDSSCLAPVNGNNFRLTKGINDAQFENNTVDIVNFQRENLLATNARFATTAQNTRLEEYNEVEKKLIHGCQNTTGKQSLITCNDNDLATFGAIILDPRLEQVTSEITTPAIQSDQPVGVTFNTENLEQNQTFQFAVYNSEDVQVLSYQPATENTTNFNFESQPEGEYYLKTTVYDQNNNPINYTETQSTNSFIVDNTAPIQEIQLNGGDLDDNQVLNSAQLDGVNYSISYIELLSEVVSGTLQLYSADANFTQQQELCSKNTHLFQEEPEFNLTCNTDTYPEGNYLVVFTAVDQAGNTDTVERKISINYILEQNSPNTTILTPENGDSINTKEIIVSGQSTDDLSGVKEVKIFTAPFLIDMVLDPSEEEQEPIVLLQNIQETTSLSAEDTQNTENESITTENQTQETKETETQTTEVETTDNEDSTETLTEEATPEEDNSSEPEASIEESTESATVMVAELVDDQTPTLNLDLSDACGAYTEVATVNNTQTDNLTTFDWQTSFEPANGPGVYCIKVVTTDFAQPGNTHEATVYNVNYEYEKSSNNELLSVELDQTPIPSFTSTINDYQIVLPIGTTSYPVVTATPVSELATVEITTPETFPGTVTIVVTAENGNTATFNLIFTLEQPEPEENSSQTGTQTISGSRIAINLQSDDDVLLSSDSCLEFTDTQNHWAYNYINQLYQLNVVCGDGLGNYNPDQDLTRAELTKIVTELFQIPTSQSTSSSFTDVSTDQWFFKYVQTLTEANIIEGYEDNTFKPNQSITRAEALKIILAAAKLIATQSENPFTDVTNSDWFYDIVTYAVSLDIIEGYEDKTFKPNQSITRAEIAKIVMLAFNLKN